MSRQYRVTWFTRLVNVPFAWLARRGLGADFRHVLTVRGRRSGRTYSTPVDAIEHDGRRWLVAPYGVTSWVRNARAAGEVQLSRGAQASRMRAREVDPHEAAPVLRRYLELVPVTRPYFAVGPDAPLDALAVEARRHPVFELERHNPVATPGQLMERADAYLTGVGLILGAAIGYALGLVLADAATAPIIAAIGAGIGLVVGAAAASLRQGSAG